MRISVRFPTATITRDFRLFQFYGLRNFSKLFSESSLPMSHSHLGQKRQFRTSANGGRISVIFSPATITRPFRFSDFTALRGFFETISESPLPMSHIFVETTISRNLQRWADFCQIFAQRNYEVFRLPNLTDIRNFSETIF